MRPPPRILLCTFGSLGDLHPFIAVGRALRDRGMVPVIATHAGHRARVEAEGIAFAPMRPDLEEHGVDPDAMRRVWRPWAGPDYLLRRIVMPALRDSLADLERAAEGAVLIVSHPLTLAAPMVAERRGLPWLSATLAPSGLLSPDDPPVTPDGRPVPRWLMPLLARLPRVWSGPARALRRELGLPDRGEPLGRGQFSPTGTLALFSPLLMRPDARLPPATTLTGFPFHDAPGEGLGGRFDSSDDAALSAFLAAGPPPVAFTLGSVAVLDARDFYEQALVAARRLGRRAVLLAGPDGSRRLRDGPARGARDALVLEYAPHSRLFPHAAATVHQGGIGTTAQALRAGGPMLVVPFGFDQPDNGARVARLGVGAVLARRRFDADRAAAALGALLDDADTLARARALGERIRREDGAARAAESIQAVLARR